MTSDTPPPVDDARDDEAGVPVAALADLSLSLDAGFGDRVRNRIERRLLAGELLDLMVAAPLRLLLELLRAPFEALAESRRR